MGSKARRGCERGAGREAGSVTRIITDHAHEPRACTTADLFKVGAPDDEDGQRELAAFTRQADAYLGTFSAPVKIEGKQYCFHCGEPFGGLMASIGFGVGIEWGLVHGEGNCSGCAWPYRGMHYPKGYDGEQLFSLRNLFLAYLPEHVSAKAAA